MQNPENRPAAMPEAPSHPDGGEATGPTAERGAAATQENRETRETRRFTVASASVPSCHHPDRNEDAVVGDWQRLMGEASFRPKIHTKNAHADVEAVERATGEESAAAATIERLGAFAVLDGVSDDLKGEGYVASRVAAGRFAKEISGLRVEALGQESVSGIVTALRAASDEVHSLGDGEFGATAVAGRVVETTGGKFEVAYAYGGNTRIYHWRRATGELIEVSTDDTLAGDALRATTEDDCEQPSVNDPGTATFISREQYDLVNSPTPDRSLPAELRELRAKNNTFSSANRLVGFAPVGRFSPHTGVIRAEAGDLVAVLTDGAHGGMTRRDIAAALTKSNPVGEILRLASGREGPNDDVTALVIRLGQEE